MGVSLKYNLEEYTQVLNKVKSLKNTIESNKTKMINSLETLRSDWTTEGGVAFFDSIDADWTDGIDNCVYVLDDLIDAMDKAYKQYTKIETEANKKLKSF